jgi:hypothetical protein
VACYGIGTLASGVAHDLNNVLVPILMVAPLLRGDVPADEREKFLTIVEASAQRGANIVRQVLTFARGAEGDRLLLQPIHLVEEISNIIRVGGGLPSGRAASQRPQGRPSPIFRLAASVFRGHSFALPFTGPLLQSAGAGLRSNRDLSRRGAKACAGVRR